VASLPAGDVAARPLARPQGEAVACPAQGHAVPPEAPLTAYRRATAAVAALLAFAVSAGPACAAPTHSPPGRSHLFLSVSGTDDTWMRGVSLHCDPPSGFHPHAQLACQALEGAQGRLDTLAPDRHMCPMVYAPVTATATGTWHGRPVAWEHTFANSCVMDARTGSVFRF
jgi:hypothetical protein